MGRERLQVLYLSSSHTGLLPYWHWVATQDSVSYLNLKPSNFDLVPPFPTLWCLQKGSSLLLSEDRNLIPFPRQSPALGLVGPFPSRIHTLLLADVGWCRCGVWAAEMVIERRKLGDAMGRLTGLVVLKNEEGGWVNVGDLREEGTGLGCTNKKSPNLLCGGSPTIRGKWRWSKPQASWAGPHSGHPVSSGSAAPLHHPRPRLCPWSPISQRVSQSFFALSSRRHFPLTGNSSCLLVSEIP